MLWVISAAFSLYWLVMVLRGRGGLVHVFILVAIAMAVVKFWAVRRARA